MEEKYSWNFFRTHSDYLKLSNCEIINKSNGICEFSCPAYVVYIIICHIHLLVQKSRCYKHHKQNYIKSPEEEITPVDLKIKTKLAFQPVLEDFEFKWNSIIFNAERSIVQLLLYESEKVIEKLSWNSGRVSWKIFRKTETKVCQFREKKFWPPEQRRRKTMKTV